MRFWGCVRMIDIATHPWLSGLLGDQEMAAIFAPEAELKRLLDVEAAWTRALGEVEGHAAAGEIATAIETAVIDPKTLAAGMAKDGVTIPALVHLLREDIGPNGAEIIHTGLTSQDVMDTSLVLALGQVLALLRTRLTFLDQELAKIQQAHGDRPMTAFTRMQPALEITVQEVFGRWRKPFAKLISDGGDLQREVSHIQWGGPVGTRDHHQSDQLGAFFARNLGLNDPGEAWHTDRTFILDVAQFLTRITIATGKIGEDVALYALARPDSISFVGGSSSAMPHKNNPVKAEALVALADFATGLVANIARACRHEGFRSGRAWTLEWLTLPQMCVATGAATTLATNMMGDVVSIGRT